MTIGDLVRDAANELDGIDADATQIRVGDRIIAALGDDGSWVEFRLDPAVALAARRTPDTGASERGPDWVRFAPATVDDHAADRARAWLGSAARLAGG